MIRTIGSLEKALILPKISHSISVITANFDILLGIILFVLSFHAYHRCLRSKVNVYILI